MARAGKGVSAMTVWMIVFVGLWLTSTVFLVILYTHQEDIRKENTDLRKYNGQLISQSEKQSIEQAKQAGIGDQTVVGALEAARANTAELASGDRAHDVATVKTKRDQLLASIRSDALVSKPEDFADVSLLDGLSRLYAEYKREQGLRTEGDKQGKELQTQVENLIATNTKERNDFETRAKDLSDKAKASEDGRASYRTDRDKEFTAIEAQIKGQRELSDAAITQLREDLKLKEQQRSGIEKRLAAQTEKYKELEIGPDVLSTARIADGRILYAVPGDEFTYIDLGERDHLVLGQQFAVYSPDGGIPADGRAKAQIEVVAIKPEYSECKIRRVSFGSVILAGDIVANPVYDRQSPQKFVVVGDFDLDRDGQSDASGAATIEALIANWGGVVVDELDALTDFVIVGRSPRKPRPVAEVPPGQVELNASLQRNLERYEKSVDTANSLSIPVMTQDVFLRFLGYTDGAALAGNRPVRTSSR